MDNYNIEVTDMGQDGELEAEIVKLDAAVDEFAALMKERLAEKARAGYRGWDDPSQRWGIWHALYLDVLDNRSAKTVDIATRAMMVHFAEVQAGVRG